MDVCELDLEIGYAGASNIVLVLRELCSFATLIGGDHAELVTPIVPQWSTQSEERLKYTTALAQIHRRWWQGLKLHLRIALSFPFHSELIRDLARAYHISIDKARSFSNGKEVSLGYATALIDCYEERLALIILPDYDKLGHVMMTSSVVRSYLVNFCRKTGAIDAFWENEDDEIVMTIWSQPATTVETKELEQDYTDYSQVMGDFTPRGVLPLANPVV